MISLNSLVNALVANITFSYHEYESDKCMLGSDKKIENSEFEQYVVRHCNDNGLTTVKITNSNYTPHAIDCDVYNGSTRVGQVRISNHTGRPKGSIGPSWAIVSVDKYS